MTSHPKVKKPPPYYNYRPLLDGWIRLIRIENSKDTEDVDEQLRITLVHKSLDACPPYTALSYTWGNPSPIIDPCTLILSKVLCCYPISCSDRILLGSRNLRDALRRIRQFQTWRDNCEEMFEDYYANSASRTLLQRTYGETSYFWIDALCIDQDDVFERSRQVSLMSRIYGDASHTIIWLGEADEYTEAAHSVLSRVALTAKVDPSTNSDQRSQQVEPDKKFVKTKDLDEDEQIAFMAIMSRNWFSRMWVLQECVLSSQLGILLGSLCFNFQLLLHAANLECENGHDYSFARTTFAVAQKDHRLASLVLSERCFNSIPRLVYIGNCKEKIAGGLFPDFLSVMASTYSLQVENPRDRIFSIRGIVSEFQSHAALMDVTDYQKSIKDVFVEATYTVVHARKDLDVISLVSPGATTPDLPSWCPDYASGRRVLRLIGYTGTTWQLGNLWSNQPSFELLHNGSLRVEGTRIDTVIESTPISIKPRDLRSPNGTARLNFGIAEVCAMAARLDLSNQQAGIHSRLSRVDILWRTLLLDELRGVSPVPAEVGLVFPDFIRFLSVGIVRHHAARGDSEDALLLSERELQEYVDRLIIHLETLITLEPLDRSLLPDPRGLKSRLVAQRDGKSSTPDIDAANLPSEIMADDKLQRTFTQAFLPLMEATMARLHSQTLGLVQAAVLPSDEVWILHGSSGPVCLRPLPHGHYQVLGEIYVHGIMHGEKAATYGPPSPIILD